MSDLSWEDLVAQARDLDTDADGNDAFPFDSPVDDIDVDDAIKAACETFYGHGFSDDQLGDVDGFGHHYRVNRWTVETDSQGFTAVTEHGSEREAIDWWSTLESEYAEWCGPGEDDATITDVPRGYGVALGHDKVGTFASRETAERELRAAMTRDQYWPDAWFIDDHGGHQRITFDASPEA